MGDQVNKAYSPVLFITGSGRSGTNITKKILAQHSQVAALPFEHRITIDPRGVIDFYQTYPTAWSPYWCDYKVKDFIQFLSALGEESPAKRSAVQSAKEKDLSGLEFTSPAYAGWELEKWFPGYSRAVDELRDRLVQFSYAGRWPGSEGGVKHNQMVFTPHLTKNQLRPILTQFLEQLNEAVLTEQGKSIFVEDNTHSILYARDLLDLYPNGKLLHIIRDPRDVLASLADQKWTPSELPQLIAWYQEVMDRWLFQRQNLEQDRHLEIRMEDLIDDPRSTIQSVCDFAGIQWEDQLLDLELNEHNRGRFTEKWSTEELQMIEQQLGHYIERFGYTLS